MPRNNQRRTPKGAIPTLAERITMLADALEREQQRLERFNNDGSAPSRAYFLFTGHIHAIGQVPATLRDGVKAAATDSHRVGMLMDTMTELDDKRLDAAEFVFTHQAAGSTAQESLWEQEGMAQQYRRMILSIQSVLRAHEEGRA